MNERKKDHYLVKSVQPGNCHVFAEPRSCCWMWIYTYLTIIELCRL